MTVIEWAKLLRKFKAAKVAKEKAENEYKFFNAKVVQAMEVENLKVQIAGGEKATYVAAYTRKGGFNMAAFLADYPQFVEIVDSPKYHNKSVEVPAYVKI
jgi:galactokinase/mevalonate kinase-like predicted kinase